MKRVLGIALAAALFASAAPAPVLAQVPLTPSAQLPAGAVDPNETLVEELVVTARLPGPAWWRVSDGDSTVYVLGAPTVAPKRQQWDQLQFNRRLEGANAVILPFTGLKVKLAGAPGAAISYLRLKSSKPFEDSQDPAQRERFAAVRTKLGQPADHYKTNHPLAAALMLTDDYREKEGLTTADPTKLIKLLAQRSGVKIVQRSYDLSLRDAEAVAAWDAVRA